MSCVLTHMRCMNIMAKITPTTPNGYVTAQLSAGMVVGRFIWARVCCDAPNAGVLVVAPHKIPSMSGSGMFRA